MNRVQEIEDRLRTSKWWTEASRTPDRHFEKSAQVMLSDHLNAVKRNCLVLLNDDPKSEYLLELLVAIEADGLNRQMLGDVLVPAALLHDIGKIREGKEVEVEHPLSGRLKKARHPLMSLIAGVELLPKNTPHRESVLALIEEHDQPYSWYMQLEKTGQAPSSKAWAKLDRKIRAEGDGSGMFLLCLFKLADIDGHEDVSDVSWFFEHANRNCLETGHKSLPIPTDADIKEVARIGGDSSE